MGERLAGQALRGAVFIDPSAEKPYLFHLALVSVVLYVDLRARHESLNATTLAMDLDRT